MRFKMSLSLAALCMLSVPVLADGPRIQFNGEIRELPTESELLLAEKDGFRIYSVPYRLGVTPDRFRTGEGQGGGVTELTVTQVAYSDPENGNVSLLVWDESAINTGGVNVYVEDALIGAVPGLPEPGTHSVFLVGFPNGLFTIMVESIDDGSTSEATQLFLDAQPFSDATNLRCSPGSIADPDRCNLAATWENPGPHPDVYLLLLNGTPMGTIPGDVLQLTVENAPPGAYTLTLVGFSSSADGEYRGGFSETSCTLSCEAIETPALDEVGLLCLFAIVLGLGWVVLRRAPAVLTRRA